MYWIESIHNGASGSAKGAAAAAESIRRASVKFYLAGRAGISAAPYMGVHIGELSTLQNQPFIYSTAPIESTSFTCIMYSRNFY